MRIIMSVNPRQHQEQQNAFDGRSCEECFDRWAVPIRGNPSIDPVTRMPVTVSRAETVTAMRGDCPSSGLILAAGSATQARYQHHLETLAARFCGWDCARVPECQCASEGR
jgi:hypothetical protein